MSNKLGNGNFFNMAILVGFYTTARTIFIIIHSFKYVFHNSSFILSKLQDKDVGHTVVTLHKSWEKGLADF